MKLTDNLSISGHLTATLHHRGGKVVDTRHVSNSITLAGRDLVMRLYNGDPNLKDTVKRVTQIRLGTGKTAFAANQTALVKQLKEVIPIEIYESSTIDAQSKTPRKQLRLTATLNENQCNDTLQEAGLFTNDNVMYNRVVFAPINKSDQFKLTLVWEIIF